MNHIPVAIRVYMEGLKTRDVDKIAGTVADDVALVTPQRTLGKERFLAFLRALYTGFPDWHYEHSFPEVEGEMIVVKWRQGGTHLGTFAMPGIEPVPATGKKVTIPEQRFRYRLRDGQRSAWSVVRGRKMVNVVPSPGSLST